MKRTISEVHEDEMRSPQLQFNTSKVFIEKLKSEDDIDLDINYKPVWIDEDDEDISGNIIQKTKHKGLYTEKLKQKYETLMGTPNWAKLNKKVHIDNEDDEILRKVGHLQKKKNNYLPKDVLEIKMFPKINSETGNEGAIISCVEFHPKLSVALVAGKSGVVSIFSIGGDVNNKLHSFKLKKWQVSTAQFTSDGSEAYISSKKDHSYCVYNLVKAEPKLVQLPHTVKQPKLFRMSIDGKYLATSYGLDEVFILCTASKELLRCLKHNHNVQSLTFNHNSEQLYCYGIQGEVTIWDLSTFRVLGKFYDNGCVTASCIAVSPCGRLLATGSGEGIVNIYETSNLTTDIPIPQKVISNLTTKITNLKFNATSEILAASSSYYPNAVKLVHIPSYHVFTNFPQQPSNLYQVNTVNFSPNSGYMAVGNNKGCAYLYRLRYFKNY